jgi:hypothetical protein
MADKKKGYNPADKNNIPGGRNRATLAGEPNDKEGTIGSKTGSITRDVGGVGRTISNAIDGGGWRAYTPKEAQKAQAAVDQDEMRKRGDYAASLGKKKVPSYKKGGIIKATGLARVHKGERMIPKAKVAKVEKLMKMKRG